MKTAVFLVKIVAHRRRPVHSDKALVRHAIVLPCTPNKTCVWVHVSAVAVRADATRARDVLLRQIHVGARRQIVAGCLHTRVDLRATGRTVATESGRTWATNNCGRI